MIHLTPQEKSVVLGLCVVLFSGTMINIGLQKQIKIFNWLHTVEHKSLRTMTNINKASVDELLRVPGIGLKTAEFILAYRAEHGRFNNLEPLKEARGMREDRYERIIKYVTVGSP